MREQSPKVSKGLDENPLRNFCAKKNYNLPPKIGKNAENRPKMGKMPNFCFFVKSHLYFAPFNPKNILCTRDGPDMVFHIRPDPDKSGKKVFKSGRISGYRISGYRIFGYRTGIIK